MSKKKKNIIILVSAVLIIAGIIYFVFFRKPKTGTITDTNYSGGNGPGQAGSDIPIIGNDNFPLKVGSYGAKVKTLQGYLNKINNNFPLLSLDGNFGNQTKTALEKAMGTQYYPVVDGIKLRDISYRAGNY